MMRMLTLKALRFVLPVAGICTLLVQMVPHLPAQQTPQVRTSAMTRQDGFFTFFWDEVEGKIWLEIEEMDTDFLYINSLATGLGSNPVGLDRSQLGNTRMVRFQRVGPKVLLVETNQRYRALSDNPAERRAVRESFAQSILWGATVATETPESVIVDATDFLLRDAHDVIGTLRRAGEGTFTLDRTRSAVYLPRTRSFPDNSEFEVTLTFQAADPGRLVSEVTPTPEAMSLRQHHSFVRLPDDGYTPRAYDPRAGANGISFFDYAAPLEGVVQKRLLVRHRLKKSDPSAAVSAPLEPIVYYLDPGVPSPVREALLEGARWWDSAFQSAGFRDAFKVELLPEGADPLDVRYNMIQWVHRSTRGWSYGSSVVDPRTGEIIKGHVLLGSLRVRQDRLLMEGLEPAFTASASCSAGSAPLAAHLAPFDPDISATQVALARIRQLSAHEVGHTLGFAHNFTASQSSRASVMDYPAPRIMVNQDESLNLSDAYGVGIGEWDKVAVQYAYSVFPDSTDESAALNTLIEDAYARGLYFINDLDGRAPQTAHAAASLWDNGADPVVALKHAMRIRRIALDKFGEGNIAHGRPQALLGNVLVPIYLHHRYQVDAAAKLLGGFHYTYKLRGDTLAKQSPVEPALQRQALAALLDTLDPTELTVPLALLSELPPLPPRFTDGRERFDNHTGRIFDPLAAVESAARVTLSAMLHRERAARLAMLHSQDPNQPGLHAVIEEILKATWRASTPVDSWEAASARVVGNVVLDTLIQLGGDPRAAHDVRAVASTKLRDLAVLLDSRSIQVGVELAHVEEALRRISAFLARPDPAASSPNRLDTPPGSPIGQQ